MRKVWLINAPARQRPPVGTQGVADRPSPKAPSARNARITNAQASPRGERSRPVPRCRAGSTGVVPRAGLHCVASRRWRPLNWGVSIQRLSLWRSMRPDRGRRSLRGTSFSRFGPGSVSQCAMRGFSRHAVPRQHSTKPMGGRLRDSVAGLVNTAAPRAAPAFGCAGLQVADLPLDLLPKLIEAWLRQFQQILELVQARGEVDELLSVVGYRFCLA